MALLLLSEVLIEVYIDVVVAVAVGGYIDVCLETLCGGGLNYY